MPLLGEGSFRLDDRSPLSLTHGREPDLLLRLLCDPSLLLRLDSLFPAPDPDSVLNTAVGEPLFRSLERLRRGLFGLRSTNRGSASDLLILLALALCRLRLPLDPPDIIFRCTGAGG